MSSITNFNRFCTDTERNLSVIAAIPVIGTPVAACKFALGTIQTITALVLGILSFPFRLNDNAKAFNDHCWTHVVHGLANMAASLVEAIPILSFVFVRIRLEGHIDGHRDPAHQFKYIPYNDLVIEDRYKYRFIYKDLLYKNTNNPTFFSPTHFRQVTGFNPIAP